MVSSSMSLGRFPIGNLSSYEKSIQKTIQITRVEMRSYRAFTRMQACAGFFLLCSSYVLYTYEYLTMSAKEEGAYIDRRSVGGVHLGRWYLTL